LSLLAYNIAVGSVVCEFNGINWIGLVAKWALDYAAPERAAVNSQSLPRSISAFASAAAGTARARARTMGFEGAIAAVVVRMVREVNPAAQMRLPINLFRDKTPTLEF